MKSYADGRKCYDADSHLMESVDWLFDHADPSIREDLPGFAPQGGAKSAAGRVILDLIEKADRRREDPEATRRLEENVVGGPKGWLAHGATDAAERRRTLDLLGFEKQLVFATFSLGQFAYARDPRIAYGGARAHNRGMTEFCSGDPRMLPVCFLPLTDPERSRTELEDLLRLDPGAMWVLSDALGDTSPSHVDLEPIWARLSEARVPVVLHIGGGKLLDRRYHANGRPMPKDWLGGGENLRSKDFPVVHHSPERFLTCLTLDGVFERHPDLRCGVIELGASWVPGMLRNLDYAARSFGRNEPLLQDLSMEPSEYIRRQVRFTPFAFEDVGWLIEESGEDLFLFSSDYPHPEGSKDPIGKFERSLEEHRIGEPARERFYWENFAHLVGA
ncbi:MAG: amidohydrolase family protein [Myxococcota bacterium]